MVGVSEGWGGGVRGEESVDVVASSGRAPLRKSPMPVKSEAGCKARALKMPNSESHVGHHRSHHFQRGFRQKSNLFGARPRLSRV